MRSADLADAAREEARACVEHELQSLMRERAGLMIERKRLEDDRNGDAATRAAIADMRARHREMELEIVDKADEIAGLKLHLTRLQTAMSAEKNATTQV